MKTPIVDFVRHYAEDSALRLHMPGHKGMNQLGRETGKETGIERWDITEIEGADSLYEAKGIIAESEENAGKLFGAQTFYSTEGSSLCIRAMLYLTMLYAQRGEGQKRKKTLIAAGRNAHKTFLSAAALLDLDVDWIYSEGEESYLSCQLDAESIEKYFAQAKELPTALYLTAPDYLGNLPNISEIAKVCRRYSVLLLVDNAHGAYLKFLPRSLHPIDLGADLCCDSAHKTLPVLTGGAYLHISYKAPSWMGKQAKNAMALFGSTSPSYLILQSLDQANAYLAQGYGERLEKFAKKAESCKQRLQNYGYEHCGDEPLKLTLRTKDYGYEGREFAELLREKKIVCEFSDPDFAVMMLTPEIGEEGMERLEQALREIPKRKRIEERAPTFPKAKQILSVREAVFSASEEIPAEQSVGRILSAATVSCPPAVPIVVCGERIQAEAVPCFAYYGITSCLVILE